MLFQHKPRKSGISTSLSIFTRITIDNEPATFSTGVKCSASEEIHFNS